MAFNARLDSARLFRQSGEFDKVVAQMDTALNFARQNAAVWYYKGAGHFGLNEFDVALKCFNRAIKLDNTKSDYYLNQGKVYLQRLAFTDAQTSFEHALRLTNESKNQVEKCQALFWSGKAFEKEGELGKAKAKYRNARKICPDDKALSDALTALQLDSLYTLASSANRVKQVETANSILKNILAIDSTYKNARALFEKNTLKPQNSEVHTKPTNLKEPVYSEKVDGIFDKINQVRKDTFIQDKNMFASKRPVGVNAAINHTIAKPPIPFYSKMNWVWWFGFSGVVVIVALVVRNRWRGQAENATLQNPFFKHIKEIKADQFPDQSRYKIETELGVGSMGRVYKAYDLQLERFVAIKLIRFENTMDDSDLDERIQRFRREARATAKLNHPNIVSLYDYNEKDHALYMTMEYVEGKSLKEILQREKRLPIATVVEVLENVLKALDYAHKNQIIHRDIKPSNIMLSGDGAVKVLDFGLAKMLNLSKQDARTITGMRMGSPAYMSPEQINSEKVDGRSDIFSLGVVLYEMLTGQTPFKGKADENLAKLFYAILNAEPLLPSSIRKDIPGYLESVLMKMLAKDKNKRFNNANEVLIELDKNSG